MRQLNGNNYSSNFLSLKLFSLLRIWEGMRGKAKDYAPHVVKASNYSLRACDSQTCTISRQSKQKVCNMLFNDSFRFYGITRLLMETDVKWIEQIDALVHVWIDTFTNQHADKKTDGLTPWQTGRQTNKVKHKGQTNWQTYWQIYQQRGNIQTIQHWLTNRRTNLQSLWLKVTFIYIEPRSRDYIAALFRRSCSFWFGDEKGKSKKVFMMQVHCFP